MNTTHPHTREDKQGPSQKVLHLLNLHLDVIAVFSLVLPDMCKLTDSVCDIISILTFISYFLPAIRLLGQQSTYMHMSITWEYTERAWYARTLNVQMFTYR